ncbi:MAG TPA: Asp23/Gls24 family envelope stress response protein [Clostridiaceae bacterium]|nr:Asp23/Gls24 family envelope stress response protein [Clostridiaceae bacterium]
MRVVGFIGPSGTGKSHRALQVANSEGIEYIIDDGLLIKGNRIIAGVSAKKEKTKIGSIKRALFIYEDHAESVRSEIIKANPESILILGTSDGMVESIAKKLGLPGVNKKIYIQDVAKEEEINAALTTRRDEGKHVIPVPTFQIKKDFSGYFLDPLQIFRRRGKGRLQLVSEKSVVRPTFSYMGKYTISDYAIYQIVEFTVMNIKGVNRITRFKVENGSDGITIDIDLILIYGYNIKALLETIQQKVKYEVERMTALNIKALNLTAKGLVVQEEIH